MKNACWTLFALSVLALVLGVVSRFTSQPMFGGVGAGTFWKASIALLGYSVALHLLTQEARRA